MLLTFTKGLCGDEGTDPRRSLAHRRRGPVSGRSERVRDPRRPIQPTGLMFWFAWKTFSGSNAAFSFASGSPGNV